MTSPSARSLKPSAVTPLPLGLVLLAIASGCDGSSSSSDPTGTAGVASSSSGGAAGGQAETAASGSGGLPTGDAGSTAGAGGATGGVAGQGGGGGESGVDADGATGDSDCPTAGPTCIGNLTDDFSSGMLGPPWLATPGCATTVVSEGAVVLARPASCSDQASAVLKNCNYRICGDFDAQVDFSLTDFTVPPTRRLYAGMAVQSLAGPSIWNMTIERFNAPYPSPFFSQPENYKAYVTDPDDSLASFVASADATGRLRITRVGTTVTAYYWKNDAWAMIVTGIAPSDEMLLLALYSGGDDPTGFTVVYDNFSLVSRP